jgi:hypothetical protein
LSHVRSICVVGGGPDWGISPSPTFLSPSSLSSLTLPSCWEICERKYDSQASSSPMLEFMGSMPGCLPRQSRLIRSSPSASWSWRLALIQLAFSEVLWVCLVLLPSWFKHVQRAPQKQSSVRCSLSLADPLPDDLQSCWSVSWQMSGTSCSAGCWKKLIHSSAAVFASSSSWMACAVCLSRISFRALSSSSRCRASANAQLSAYLEWSFSAVASPPWLVVMGAVLPWCLPAPPGALESATEPGYPSKSLPRGAQKRFSPGSPPGPCGMLPCPVSRHDGPNPAWVPGLPYVPGASVPPCTTAGA